MTKPAQTLLTKAVIFLTLVLWPLNYILASNFPKAEIPKTVFEKDYQAEQLILRNTYLYPNILTARIFQNKGRIYLNKFTENFFALTDPNNYFFGLHPRPIVPDNKNLFKFPFVAIVFFFYGIFYFNKFKYKKILLFYSLTALTFLSILKNFDGYDIILWLPISLIIIHGTQTMEKMHRKLFIVVSTVFLIFAVPEIVRSFITL
jgi:hypothetical protein